MESNLFQLLIEAFPKIILPGLALTLPMTAVSFLFALIIAVIAAMIQYANVKVLKQIIRGYIWIMRGTPLLIQLYVVFFGLPSVGVLIDPVPAAILVFSLNEGAYCAETIRGAMEAVPRGQIEAGYCTGMSYMQIMWHIVLPQTFKSAFPALSNSLIGLVKDTSLAFALSVMEMFTIAKMEAAAHTTMVPFIVAGVFYYVFNFVVAWGMERVEKAMGYYR